jgi:hypothetical protein
MLKEDYFAENSSKKFPIREMNVPGISFRVLRDTLRSRIDCGVQHIRVAGNLSDPSIWEKVLRFFSGLLFHPPCIQNTRVLFFR